MTRYRPFTLIASAIFAIMALVHLYRIIRPFEIHAGNCTIPMWVSWVGVAVAAWLSTMLFREAQR